MIKRAFLGLLLAFLLTIVLPLSAQEPSGELRVVRTDTSGLPTVDLTLFARDSEGTPIDLSSEFVAVKHNGVTVDNAQPNGRDAIGTFTLFLLDLPPGVAGSIDEMQRSIQAYTQSDFMQEQVDDVAVYRVDELGAVEMQGPTFFHNDIVNLFTRGVDTQSGPTALIDSVGDLLTRAETFRREPAMTTSIVVFSDGTDSISQNFSDTQLYGLARDKGIKIYTVLVENADLIFSAESGRGFMEEMAVQTGGSAVLLPDLTSTKIMWSEIAESRDLPVISYTPTELVAGSATVEVSLPNYPEIPAVSTSVTVPANLPQVTINVPEESRSLTVEELVSPVSLSFPTSVSWLDGETRLVEQAQLLINDSVVIDVEPATLARATAEMALTFGENTVQVIIVDDAGQSARSAPLVLTVEQGATSIPREIRAGSAIPWRIILYVLVCLVILGLLIYLFKRMRQGAGPNYGGWRKRMQIARAERSQKRAATSSSSKANLYPEKKSRPVDAQRAPSAVTSAEYQPTMPSTPISGAPSIEVLDARSSIASLVPVNRSEFLIGRSPTVDLALTEDATVSRIHATIVEDNGQFRIYDEQSTSGTYVNDREVPEYGLQLSSGDEIHIGAVHLRFRA